MRKFKFGKLVRDKIVSGIQEAGNAPVYRILTDEDYVTELKKKVLEEAMEIPNEKDHNELRKEIADVQEVLDNLIIALGSLPNEIKEIHAKKNAKAGSFKKRYYIEHVETKDNSPWNDHYLASPEKYPEMLEE